MFFHMHALNQPFYRSVESHQSKVKANILSKVEIHPRLPQNNLVEFAQSHNITVEGYSPFGNANVLYKQEDQLLEDAVLKQIAEKHNVSPSSIITSWVVSRGIGK